MNGIFIVLSNGYLFVFIHYPTRLYNYPSIIDCGIDVAAIVLVGATHFDAF